MNDWLQYLMIPIVVSILGGAVLYMIKSYRLRRAMINGLINEINCNIMEARDLQEYLSKDNHLWFKEGELIDEPPIFVEGRDIIYETYLKDFYLLTKNEINKVTLFYGNCETCKNKIVVFFHRIQQQSESKNKLSRIQAEMNKLRAKKICCSLEALCNTINHHVKRLSDLPNEYREIDTSDIDRQMNELKKGIFKN